MAKLHIHPVGLVLIFFGFLVWVVALGGLAAVTNYCLKAEDTTTASGETVSAYCGRTYQLQWWAIFFELFLLIVMLVTCFLNAFDRARFIYLTYLSLVTALLTISSRDFINSTVLSYYQNGGISIHDSKQSANNAAAAGTIMLGITNYALIIFIGLAASASQQASQASAAPEQRLHGSSCNGKCTMVITVIPANCYKCCSLCQMCDVTS